MNTIGIITKPQSPNIKPLLDELAQWLEERKKKVIVDFPTIEDPIDSSLSPRSQIANEADLLLVLGGDGTMLGAARLVEERSIPILGVNVGGLGFLTETTVPHLYSSLTQVLAGEYVLDKRLMLNVNILRQQEFVTSATVLNDVVVSKGHLARMISTKVWIDGTFMTNLRGDGLIIASPTGSTAYSLSASGPILDPSLEVLIINPICPHTLSHRPFLVPSHVSVKIALTSQAKAMGTFDGQLGVEMNPGDIVEVSASDHRAHLIRFPDRSYYDVLRNKLKWGDG